MKIVTDNLTVFYVENGSWVKAITDYFRERHIRLIHNVSCNRVTCFNLNPEALIVLKDFCDKNGIELISVPMGAVHYRGKRFDQLKKIMWG